jgi:hypothetical protein
MNGARGPGFVQPPTQPRSKATPIPQTLRCHVAIARLAYKTALLNLPFALLTLPFHAVAVTPAVAVPDDSHLGAFDGFPRADRPEK